MGSIYGPVMINWCFRLYHHPSGCKCFTTRALGVEGRYQLRGGGLLSYSDVGPCLFCTHRVHQFTGVSLKYASHPLAPLLHSRAFSGWVITFIHSYVHSLTPSFLPAFPPPFVEYFLSISLGKPVTVSVVMMKVVRILKKHPICLWVLIHARYPIFQRR